MPARLRRYEYPHVVRFVDALPRTLTGKVQRFRLRESPSEAAATGAPESTYTFNRLTWHDDRVLERHGVALPPARDSSLSGRGP